MKTNTVSNDKRFELLWRLLRRHIVRRSRVDHDSTKPGTIPGSSNKKRQEKRLS
jgi:hypothetical protein